MYESGVEGCKMHENHDVVLKSRENRKLKTVFHPEISKTKFACTKLSIRTKSKQITSDDTTIILSHGI